MPNEQQKCKIKRSQLKFTRQQMCNVRIYFKQPATLHTRQNSQFERQYENGYFDRSC